MKWCPPAMMAMNCLPPASKTIGDYLVAYALPEAG
jgi:hypothetical protein